MRAALGASAGALRRTLLAESLLLCGAGAVLGVLLARPMVAVLASLCRALLRARARRHGRRQPAVGRRRRWRWSRPCCSPSSRGCRRRGRRTGSALSSGSVRITPGTNRRLRVFAITQIAASFVLLAGAGMLLTTLIALQRRRPASTCEQVLAVDVPVPVVGAPARRR